MTLTGHRKPTEPILMEGAAIQPMLKERVMRTIRTACAVMACAIGLMVAVPSVAVADEGSGTCTAAQRTELRQEMAGLRAQILDLRLSPAEIAAKKKAHRDRKSTRLNSSHVSESRMPSSA